MNRLLLGASFFLAAALLILFSMYGSQAEKLGETQQIKRQLEQAVIEQTQALITERERAEENERLHLQAERDKSAVRTEMASIRRELNRGLDDEQCADTALPGDVAERLRNIADHRASDRTGATAAGVDPAL